MVPQEPDRLRIPPRERFAEDVFSFDLTRVFDNLADEPHPGIDGHRQIAIYKGGSLTTLALLFETGGTLPRHQTAGVVTLQLLSGRLAIETGHGEETVIGPNGLMVIQPQVFFSIQAREPSRLLMTVSRPMIH